MRILANFSKKVPTGQYENETYTVTFEAESEFNNVAEIADYLFHQAREAVQRQLEGTSAKNTPATNVPPAGADANQSRNAQPNQTGTNFPATDKQKGMIAKMLKETFDDAAEARQWLMQNFGAESTAALTRKLASKVIEALIERRGNAA